MAGTEGLPAVPSCSLQMTSRINPNDDKVCRVKSEYDSERKCYAPE